MNNCPNCGAVIEPHECKCKYCGTWYFDFTAFDMTDDKPYYVKFRTPYGIITTLARPELQAINLERDEVSAIGRFGMPVATFTKSVNCDLEVIFHSYADPETNNLFTLEAET